MPLALITDFTHFPVRGQIRVSFASLRGDPHTNTPIVPVAIRGTIDILPRGTRSMHKGKRVDVTIGAPIDVAGKTVDQLATQVRAFLIDHVER